MTRPPSPMKPKAAWEKSSQWSAILSRTVIVLIVFAIVTAIVFSEIFVLPPKKDHRVHVTYWEKWTGFEFDAMKAVVDAFNRSQDRITVDILSVSGIDSKTMIAVAGGIPPDVAGLFGSNLAQYADNHALMELDDFCKEAGIKREQYVESYWDNNLYHGHIYALVSTPASIALHYNTELFEKAGYDPSKPPMTIGELNAMAEKMTERDSRKRIKVSGFLPSEPGWWNWAWGCFFGGKLWNGKDTITCDDPKVIEGYEWIQSFSKKYGPGDIQTFRSGLGNFQSPQNAFMQSQVAMEIQGVWMANFIQQYNKKLKWAAAPFPYPDGRPDLANPTIVDEDILTIPVGAKHPKEAFEFLKFVQSQKGMELLCMGQKKNSPLKRVSPEFFAKHPNPYIKLFTDLSYSKNAYRVPQTGIWPEYLAELNTATDEIILLKKTPKQAMQDVKARIQPKLDEYLKRLKMRGLK